MGVGWRRFSERVKEKTAGGKKNIPATSNKRNLAMLEELAVFSTQLKHQEKDLRAMKLAVETALKTTRQTMAYPLPRVYYEDEDTANDSVTKQSPIVPISDSCVTHDFSALTLEAGSKLGADTFTPVVRWQTTFEMLQAKNRDVQNLRLEVDSRRRTVKQLAAKLEVVRGKAYANSKHASEADKLAMKLQHKEGKLLVTEERYRQEEEELHRKLVVLCQQAALLRNFTSAALRIESELLMEAAEAVGQIDAALVPPTPTSPYTSVFAASAAARPLSTSAGSAVVVPVTVPEDSVLEGEDLEGTPAGLVPAPAASEHSARLESQDSLQEGSVPTSPTAAAVAVVAGGDAVTPQKSITNPVYDHENGQMVPPTPPPANGATAAAGTPTAAAPVPRTGSPPPNGVHASSQPESPAGSVVFHDEELDQAPLPPKFLPSQGGYHDAELDAAPLPPKHLPSQAGSEEANGKLGPMEAYHARLASY